MLNNKQITEIREHLDKAQNPIFFFDNDVDGLTSFLVLQRYIGNGKGVAIRGASEIGATFFKKVEELGSDYIFVLDNSRIGDEFLKLAKQKGIPVVCIDHHDVPKPVPELKNYYNTYHTSKKIEPTVYLCYKVTKRKQDEWLAVMGCIADGFVPEFLAEVQKQYPELIDKAYKNPFDIRYKTEFGKIVHILGYGLFDRTTNVVAMLKFLMKAKGPQDILEENQNTQTFLERYGYIKNKVDSIVKKAEKNIDKEKKLLYFTYSGDMSVSQYVSDQLMYNYPDLVLVIGFIKGNSAKFSLRGPIDVKKLTLAAIKDIEGATGGGHEHATGAQMTADAAPKFKKNILKLIN